MNLAYPTPDSCLTFTYTHSLLRRAQLRVVMRPSYRPRYASGPSVCPFPTARVTEEPIFTRKRQTTTSQYVKKLQKWTHVYSDHVYNLHTAAGTG